MKNLTGHSKPKSLPRFKSGVSRRYHRSADFPVRSKLRTLNDSGCVKGGSPLTRFCEQECPRSGSGGSVKLRLFISNRLPAALVFALLALACLILPASSLAATVWNGPPTAFSKSGADDPTLPANQDRINPNVWLTRGGIQGLYNAKTESGFIHSFSPADTQWADGTTANYSSLSYVDWNTWAKTIHGGPPSTVGVAAVLHLITDDIYIDITFTSWAAGGDFSYQRSTPAAVNLPPSVTITNPPNNTVLAAPASLTLRATASDSDGAVAHVQFFQGAGSLGNVGNSPYSVPVNNLPAGDYTFSAVATDNSGSTATNAITVHVVTPAANTFSGAQRLSGTNFQFSYAATIGLRYVVQRSSDLSNWTSLATNTAATNPVLFQDTTATGTPRFYRVGRLPNP
jgi:hypothetical protein